jgi:hypothetical protein
LNCLEKNNNPYALASNHFESTIDAIDYGKDEASGTVCGIYFFETEETLDEFCETEIAKTIPDAYEATEIRLEVYDVLNPLRPER